MGEDESPGAAISMTDFAALCSAACGGEVEIEADSDASLVSIGMDSFALLEILISMEDRLGVHLPTQGLPPECVTGKDLYDWICGMAGA